MGVGCNIISVVLRQFHVNIIVFIVRFIVKFFRNSLSGKLYVFLIDDIVNVRNGTFLASLANFRSWPFRSPTISNYFNRNIRIIETFTYVISKILSLSR